MKPSILIVENEPDTREALRSLCARDGLFESVVTAEHRRDAEEKWAKSGTFDALLLDINLGHEPKGHQAGYTLLQNLRQSDRAPHKVFIYSGHISDELKVISAVAPDRICAFQKGGKDRSALFEALADYAREFASLGTRNYIECDALKDIDDSISKIAKSDLPVLLTGGTGDGKTLRAKEIAKAAQMIAGLKRLPNERVQIINCAAIADGLFEDTFFGHKMGAFTDAKQDVLGKLMVASGFKNLKPTNREHPGGGWLSEAPELGIVILDEVGAMPLHFQAKLLTILDGEAIQPLGCHDISFRPNFRVIATTNEVEKLSSPTEFRRDLLKRLEGWVIRVPSVFRQEDVIRKLVKSHWPKYRDKDGDLAPLKIEWSSDAITCLLEAAKKIEGGFRELRNIVARAVLHTHFASGKEVSKAMVTKALEQQIPMRGALVSDGTDEEKILAQQKHIIQSVATILLDLGVRDEEFVGAGVTQFSYKRLVKAVPIDVRQKLADAMQKDDSLDPDHANGDKAFKRALQYKGNNGRNTVYRALRRNKQ